MAVMPWISIFSCGLEELLEKWVKMILKSMFWLGDKDERKCVIGEGTWQICVEESLNFMK